NENILLETKHTTAKSGEWNVGDTWTAPPETVEDLLAYCADLNANKDASGKADPITPFVFPAKASHWFRYLIQLWWAQYQGVYEENTLNVQEGDGTFYDFWNYESLDVYRQKGIQKGIETVESIFIDKGTGADGAGGWKNSAENVDSYDVKDAERQFVKGDTAMLIGASFMYNDVKDYMPEGMVFKMMHTPTIENAAKNADGTTQKINYYTKEDFWIIPAKAPNKELAKEFMTFLCSEEWLVEFTRRAGSFRPFEYGEAVRNDTEFEYNEFAKSLLDIYETSDVKLVSAPANIDPEDRTLMSLYKIGSLNVSGRMVWATFMKKMKTSITAAALMEEVISQSTKDYNTWKRDLEG
ncbi:MAG: extracellular solute-binding protein, partial [Clostridia bacterium]|nr:extracellular solute-binding protein [Clostridia bacterium]